MERKKTKWKGVGEGAHEGSREDGVLDTSTRHLIFLTGAVIYRVITMNFEVSLPTLRKTNRVLFHCLFWHQVYFSVTFVRALGCTSGWNWGMLQVKDNRGNAGVSPFLSEHCIQPRSGSHPSGSSKWAIQFWKVFGCVRHSSASGACSNYTTV